MQQLLAHLVGDYILQSHDMATKFMNKLFEVQEKNGILGSKKIHIFKSCN